jgi:Fic family protein
MTREYQKTHPWLKFSVDFTRALPSFWAKLGECRSKCEHLAGVPLRPDVAKQLHAVYLAKGIWGTTAIEGNTLSEQEVRQHIEGKLEVPASKEYLKQEIDNILQESNRMLTMIAGQISIPLSPERIKQINAAALKGLALEERVIPGRIRTYSVGVMTYRGAPAKDCEYLLEKLCGWLNSEEFNPRDGLDAVHMAILKAMIAHLYIEWIHPFGDGNGRTGRLIEVQILLSAGVPSPASHLLSNHYNLTRRDYLLRLKAASESGGEVLPFLTYALEGFLEGLREQIAYVRTLQMEVMWVNYVHDYFRGQDGRSAERQKWVLLDLYEKAEAIAISEIDKLSPRLAKAYANVSLRTLMRDVESLEKEELITRKGKKIRANQALIAQFLPICAHHPPMPDVGA